MATTNLGTTAVKVTVYSKPRCVQCGAVYRWLDKHDVKYEVVNLPDFPELLEEFKAENLMQAPIVQVGDHPRFSGFRPDLLQEYLLGL